MQGELCKRNAEGEIIKEDLNADTRTFIYVEVLKTVKRYSLNKKCWVPVAEYVEEALLSEEEYAANMRRDVGYYPLPISAAQSSLGDV
jgi:hypothetical protein